MTTELATPQLLDDAMAIVQNPEATVEDRAAMYGLLYEIKRRIDRALGTYARHKSTPKTELAEALARSGADELGPLYLAYESFDVEWPCNAEENWGDVGVQEAMAVLSLVSPEYIKHIPDHYEIAVAALGSDVHAGDPVALQLFRECKARGWRTDGGKKATLKVREIKAPKEAKP